PLNLHRAPPPQLALLELEQLVTRGVLEDERVADPHGLTVDLERAPPLLVLDPVVVADCDELLPHPIRGPAHTAALVATFLPALPTPLPKAHRCLLRPHGYSDCQDTAYGLSASPPAAGESSPGPKGAAAGQMGAGTRDEL